MSLFFRPARQLRRTHAGRPCPGCGMTVHHADLVIYAAPARTYYLHEACAQVLAEQAAAASGAEEDAPETAATAEQLEPLDAEDTIVPRQSDQSGWRTDEEDCF